MARVNLDAPVPTPVHLDTPVPSKAPQQPVQDEALPSTPQHSTTSPHKPTLVLPTRPQVPHLHEAMDESQPEEVALTMVPSAAQDVMTRWKATVSKPASPGRDVHESAQSAWRQPAPRVLLPRMADPHANGTQRLVGCMPQTWAGTHTTPQPSTVKRRRLLEGYSVLPVIGTLSNMTPASSATPSAAATDTTACLGSLFSFVSHDT